MFFQYLLIIFILAIGSEYVLIEICMYPFVDLLHRSTGVQVLHIHIICLILKIKIILAAYI